MLTLSPHFITGHCIAGIIHAHISSESHPLLDGAIDAMTVYAACSLPKCEIHLAHHHLRIHPIISYCPLQLVIPNVMMST